MPLERLQKYMAHCGVASRRKCEEMIQAGRVLVNGEPVTELGVKVDPERDKIKVDGRNLRREERKVYYMLHKPRGITTTAADELGRKTVIDLVPEIRERVYPVGRLDRDSEGLLVLTNDGDLANYMTHPSYGVRKVYRATVEGAVSEELLRKLVRDGVRIGPVKVKPLAASLVKRLKENTVVEITVGEGINREVRRLFAALGHEVKRLIRVKEGPLSLKGLGKRQYRPLHADELAALRKGMRGGGDASPQPEQRTRVFNRQAARQGKPDPARKGGGRPRRNKGGKRPDNAAPQKKTAPAKKNAAPKPKGKPKTGPAKPRKHPLSGR